MTPGEWKLRSPRPELAVRREDEKSLALFCPSAESHGWLEKSVPVQAGGALQVAASYSATATPHPARSISARVTFLDQAGKQVRPPDYLQDLDKREGLSRQELVATIPAEARSARIQLIFGWAAGGRCEWRDVSVKQLSSPEKRLVRSMVVYHRPSGLAGREANVESFCRVVEAHRNDRPDIICLPEGITVVGNGKSYAEVAEAVPGPTTERLGRLAKSLNSWIVAGIYERSDNVIYNTAVLINREGKFAGKYRKTHLPREEVEGGLTPGNDYPVFDTDFGRIGLIICWDLQFPEPSRAMALAGAEMLLLPIWGGSEVLARARAIENHVWMLTSSYDMKTFIVDPTGEVLAEADKTRPVATVEIDLNREMIQKWLGNMKARTWKERRPDIPVELRRP